VARDSVKEMFNSQEQKVKIADEQKEIGSLADLKKMFPEFAAEKIEKATQT
jgi:hypothetical protein